MDWASLSRSRLALCSCRSITFSFFVCFKEDVDEVFRTYTMVSFWVAVVGIVIVVFNLVVMHEWVPLQSIMLEPAHYVTVVVPAYYYALKNKTFARYIFVVLLISILLSGSSVGLLALCLSILLVPDRIRLFRLFFGLLYAVAFIVILYLSYEPLRLRIDDTVKAVVTDDFGVLTLVHTRWYRIYMWPGRASSSTPIVGSGLGSHELTHENIFMASGVLRVLWTRST